MLSKDNNLINNLVPVGSMCTPTHQIREFKHQHNIPVKSYPLDWCFSPHNILEVLCSEKFKIEKVLKNPIHREDGSIEDPSTDIIFNPGHGLSLEQEKDRFVHTYKHFEQLKSTSNIIFVRYNNMPNSFSYTSIVKSLHRFLDHDKFKFVVCELQQSTRPGFIQLESTNEHVQHYKINETTTDWEGTTESWVDLLTHVTKPIPPHAE